MPEMEWDAVIKDNGRNTEFTELPEGDYNFTVTRFEREHFAGSAKMPPCNKAALTLRVGGEKTGVDVRCNLFLVPEQQWKLFAFFRSIGQKVDGEELKMDWSRVEGAKGRAHFAPRKYTGRDGEEHTVNDVKRFLDYDPQYFFEEVTTDDDLPF